MSQDRLAQAIDAQGRNFARALSRARRGDVAGVHQARVASRRLREMLPLTEGGEDPPPWRRLRRQVRRVTLALGAVRELDVTRTVLAAAAERHTWRSTVVAALIRDLDADRRDRHAKLVDTLHRVRTRTLLRDVRRTAAGPTGDARDHHWNETLDRRRGARAAALASRLRELSTLYVPDRLHAVRLAAKKLRYTLELERTVRRSAATADLRTLEAIQERLGELHDLQVLLDRLREVKRHAGMSRTVIAELPCMRMDIERECRSQHAQVVSRIPVWLRLAERRAGH